MTTPTESGTAKVGARSNRGSKPGEHRGGRTKGTPNKINALLKDQILAALDKAGGVKYLTDQAAANPTAFLTLVGKVLPMQITGEGGGPVQQHIEAVVTFVRPGEAQS